MHFGRPNRHCGLEKKDPGGHVAAHELQLTWFIRKWHALTARGDMQPAPSLSAILHTRVTPVIRYATALLCWQAGLLAAPSLSA